MNTTIQQALNAGEKLVRIPTGTHRTPPLRVRSGTHIVCEPGAHIIFADHAGQTRDDYLLSGCDAQDITIEGGIWDGNCPGNIRGPDAPGSYTGVMLNFIRCRNLTLRNLTLRDAVSYHIRIGETHGFRCENIRFEAGTRRPNQDGIHVGGDCSDGVITDISAHGPSVTNDDLVALVADDACHRAQNLGMICGPIRNVRVERISADDCHSLVRLASVRHWIENVVVRDVTGGAQHCAVNADALRYCAVPVFDAQDPRFVTGVGLLKNVVLENFTAFKTHPSAAPLFLLETRMENVVMRNIRRDTGRDQYLVAPFLRIRGIETDTATLDGQRCGVKRGDEFIYREPAFEELAVKTSTLQELPW